MEGKSFLLAVTVSERTEMFEEFKGTSRFSILKRLGAGGMGVVYEAHDHERRTRVALKTLRNVDPVSIYRFKMEFRSLTELSHENLLPLYELFCEDGQWFFTMELLEGATDLLTYIRGSGKQHTASDLIDSDSQEGRTSAESAEVGEAGECLSSISACEPTSQVTSLQYEVLTSEATSVATSFDQKVPEPHASDAEATSLYTVNSFYPELARRQQISSPVCTDTEPAVPQLDLDYDRLRKAFLQVAKGVRALHGAGKVHRDLKPENVMVRVDGSPVLLDFGLILNLKTDAVAGEEPRRETRSKAGVDHTVSGTFAYMAPEQATGAPILNSSDWYAFGGMLFQALTGRLPFAGKGIEIVRAKLDAQAPPPSRYVAKTPRDLDLLCVGLLDRDPAKRPTGIEVLRCLGGEEVVAEDASQNQPLFIGRDSYLNVLEEAYGALEEGKASLVCVHGCSGVGKTALLQHFLQATVVERGGVLLEGRCYEQESVPYKAFDNLVDALTQLLLDMPSEQLPVMLPENIQALARVFPVLRRVSAIGKVKTAIANNPLLLRHQAFAALGQLLAAVAAKERLVLSIDDLQWGDVDSAQLLASVLAQQPAPRMLVLLSYRSEYAGNPVLKEFRRAWESGHLRHREMEVLPLTPEESRRLASELLAGLPAASAHIHRIVEQARGSAFFVQELAENVRAGVDLQMVAEGAPGAKTQSGDLDHVLWQRVQKLPAEARQLMEIIAVAGQPIQIGDLIHTQSFSGSAQQAVKTLRLARLVRSTGARLTDEIETFHDRVRESITSFLDEGASRGYHLQIADALELNAEAAPETIASHLQAGRSPRAAHFYELAGERAIHALAFDRAEEYLRSASRLAPTSADRVRVDIRLVHFYTDTARFQDAYNIGSEAVDRFGVKLPKTFVPPLLLANMVTAFLRTGRRKPSQLIDLREMKDERLIAVVGVIAATAKAAYQVRPEICVSICTMAVNLCLKHGNTPDAAVVYMVFGCIFLGGILGRIETGHEFGRLALALVDKYKNEKQRAEVNFVVGYFGTSWMKPAVEAEHLWKVAFEEGQRTGDLFHTGCAVSGTIQGMIMRGARLDEVSMRLEQFWPVVEQAQLREPMTCLASTRKLLAKLRSPVSSSEEAAAEDAQLLADLAGFGSRHFAHFHFLNQCMLHALIGDVATGLKAAERSEAYLADSKGLLNTPEHFFWSAMLRAMDPSGARTSAKQVAKARSKFARWASRCPANFALRHEMLAAEEARLRSKYPQALDHYQRAVELGTRQNALHLLGFANQRAYALAARMGRDTVAQQYAQAAESAYAEWGALALAPGFRRPAEIPTSPTLS